jgi:hypothetical protein
MVALAAPTVAKIRGTGSLLSLAGASVAAAGQDFSVPTALSSWAVSITTTGSPTFSVAFQGSLDDVNWFNIGSAMTATGMFIFQSVPLPYVRCNLASITGGGTVSATICGAASASGKSSLLTGLVSYYAMESEWVDSLGVNNLTATAAPTQAAGIIGQALSVASASSQYLSGAVAGLLTSAGSYSMWMKPNGVQNAGPIPLSLGAGTTNVNFMQFTNASNACFCNFPAINLGLGNLAGGSWYHVVATWAGTACAAYLNGVLQNSGTATVSALSKIFLGSDATPTAAHYFNGLIDEVGLWAVTLGQSQVTSLFNSGAAVTWPFTGVP